RQVSGPLSAGRPGSSPEKMGSVPFTSPRPESCGPTASMSGGRAASRRRAVSKGDRVGAPPVKRPPREPLAPETHSQEGVVEQTTEPVDELIGQVERFYQSLTGQTAPPPRDAPYAPIPPEKDPERHLAEQVDRLLASLGQLSPAAS